MNSTELANKINEILDSKKAIDIEVIKVADKTQLADYFVVATGTSATHVRSLTQEVEAELEKIGINPKNSEGKLSNSWMVLDYGDVIVNVFSHDAREYYELDKLWK